MSELEAKLPEELTGDAKIEEVVGDVKPEDKPEDKPEEKLESDGIKEELLGNAGIDEDGEPLPEKPADKKEEEDKPPENEVKPVVEEEEEEIPPEIDKLGETAKTAFIRERQKARTEKKKREEAELKIAEFEKVKKDEPKKPEITTEQAAKNNAFAFQSVVKAKRALEGDVAVPGIANIEQAQALQKAAFDVIALMLPEDQMAVLAQAEAGEFGENGAEVIELIERELPKSQARKAQATQETDAVKARYEKQASEGKQKIDDGIKKAYEKYPALKENEKGKESAEFKFAMDWMSKNVGTMEKPGLFFSVLQTNPENTSSLFDKMMTEYSFSVNKDAVKERDTMKAKLDLIRSPDSGGRPNGGGKGAMKESDKIKNQLIQENGITEID